MVSYASAAAAKELKEVVDIDDALNDPHQWSSPLTKTLNLGTSCGDTEHQTNIYQASDDQTTTEQLSSKTAGKRQKKQIDADFNARKRAKLEQYNILAVEYPKLQQKCQDLEKLAELAENSGKNYASHNQQIHSLATSQTQHIQSLCDLLKELQREKGKLREEMKELRGENKELKSKMECLTQSKPINLTYGDQFVDLSGPSQPMQTGGAESERYTPWGN